MVSFKIVFGSKDGKCIQKDVEDPAASKLLGKNVGDKIAGDMIGFAGYEFEITGGSDSSGFPMRKDIPGPSRKRILAVQAIGLHKGKYKGMRKRKTVCGAMIHPKIVQVNMKVLKAGAAPLVEPEAPKEEAKEAEKA